MIRTPGRLLSLASLTVLAIVGLAQQYPAELLRGLEWRDVGPMRGGRTYGVAGHASQPDTFYFGSVGGGVWKTENSGHTWLPISDEGIPIGSIGAIAVAPSDANVIYVGTGEPDIRSQHSYGIGMFKSTDARQDVEADRAGRRGRSGGWWWIRRTRIGYMLRRWGMCTRRIPSAACTGRRTAARRGRKSCSRPTIRTTWAQSTWRSIRRTRGCCTRRCGRRGVRRGRCTRRRICREEGFISPPTAAIRGSNWPADFRRTISWARSGSRSRRQSQPAVGGGGRRGRAACPLARAGWRARLRRTGGGRVPFGQRGRDLEAGEQREPSVGPRLVFRAAWRWTR